MLGCVSVLGMVISGKKSAWWLIGLAPVLALFYHRFVVVRGPATGVVENPPLVAAELATFVRDDDMVLGLVFKDTPVALPFAALYAQPVVLMSDRDRRIIVLWSAFANRALAFSVDRNLKARELEVVSMPANGLLLYNNKYGQFIYGVTGRTRNGDTPAGFARSVPMTKATWKQWHSAHPTTIVMTPAGPLDQLPVRALEPYFKLPTTRPTGVLRAAGTSRVALVGDADVVAIDPALLNSRVTNASDASLKLLIIKDAAGPGVRVFERRVRDDLFPNFRPHTDRKNPAVALVDSDSNSLWTLDARCVAGELKGERLRPVPVDEDVPLDVMRFWYPNLRVLGGAEAIPQGRTKPK